MPSLYLSPYFQKKVVLCLLVEAIFTAAIATGVLLGVRTYTKRSLAFGVICDIFNIIMYASPLTILVSTYA